MVTGRRAFSGDSSCRSLAKILNEEPDAAEPSSPRRPPDVEKTILRCLRKDPARRYQTMADLKVALEDLHRGIGGATAQAPTASRADIAAAGPGLAIVPVVRRRRLLADGRRGESPKRSAPSRRCR